MSAEPTRRAPYSNDLRWRIVAGSYSRFKSISYYWLREHIHRGQYKNNTINLLFRKVNVEYLVIPTSQKVNNIVL